MLQTGPVEKDPSEPTRPFVYYAQPANHRFTSAENGHKNGTSGKGPTVSAALTGALGEAVERYSGGCWDLAGVRFATRADLDGDALDPRDLVLYRPEQYDALPYTPYTDENVLGWVHARSLASGVPVWVPAIAAFMDYEIRAPGEFLTSITSSGLAAGPTLRDAVQGAIEEVLERDAFMIAWMNRLPGRLLDPSAHPDADVRAFYVSSLRRGVHLHLVQLPTDHPAVTVAAIGVEDGPLASGPAAVVGLGCSLDPASAARQALFEVGQVRPSLRRRARMEEGQTRLAELLADPLAVETLDDHDLLYCDRSMLSAFDFWLDREPEPVDWAAWSEDARTRVEGAGGELDALLAFFRDAGQDVLYLDLTPLDMHALGLHTARAILPGYQPIHFGRRERRLGGRRLYELPHALGLSPQPTTPESLNPDPHPIA